MKALLLAYSRSYAHSVYHRGNLQGYKMAPASLLLAVFGALSLPTALCAKQCYGIDGTVLDDSFAPCDPDAEVSACCATNKDSADICLSSGLCYAQDGVYEGFIYSNGCTDRSGEDSACPHFCLDSMVLPPRASCTG